MLKKTLIAMMCSLSLVACGGGGGGSSSSGSADGGQVTTPASDLDKAKQLVKTTNAIVSYYDGFQNIADQYKVPAQVINDTSSDLSRATEMVTLLSELALEDAHGQSKQYSSTDLEKLLEDYAISRKSFVNYDLKNNTLSIEVSAGSVKVNGSADVGYWDGFKTSTNWQFNNPAWLKDKNNFIYNDQTHINVTNMVIEAPFIASQSTYNFKVANGGVIEIVNSAAQKAKFSFTADSTASMVYATAETMENREGIPDQATLKLQGLVFESADVKVALSELSFVAKKVQFNKGVETLEQLIPSELVLKGLVGYQQESLNLEAKFNLNNDLSKVIDVSAGQETSTNFINANLNVKLSGNLKGANAAPTPFSIDIAAKRAEFTKGTATVAVVVDKNALDIDLSANGLDQDHQIIAGVIKHKNGASISIADVDNFTSANILVSGKSYGTLTKNSSGQYVVKFTDDTITYIAP